MPQPVDFQTELGRMSAAERIQSIADRASLAAQQRHTVEEEESRLTVETQVRETPETENPEVQADSRRKNPFAGRRRKKAGSTSESSKEGEHNELPDNPEDHHIDVQV